MNNRIIQISRVCSDFMQKRWAFCYFGHCLYPSQMERLKSLYVPIRCNEINISNSPMFRIKYHQIVRYQQKKFEKKQMQSEHDKKSVSTTLFQ